MKFLFLIFIVIFFARTMAFRVNPLAGTDLEKERKDAVVNSWIEAVEEYRDTCESYFPELVRNIDRYMNLTYQ